MSCAVILVDSTFICEWFILFVLVAMVDVISFGKNLHFDVKIDLKSRPETMSGGDI